MYIAIRSDNPIRDSDEDLLNRAGHARRLARQVLTFDLSEGLVVGVLGPWGSGKTSFVNLMRGELTAIGAPILDFNPWMFSGAQQLVDSFFAEISSQLKLKPGLADIGKDLADYGEAFGGLAWLPVVGPWIDRGTAASKLVGKILQRRKEGIGTRRSKLNTALAKLKLPICVLLDDVDRLTTSEIRDIFKLVRLTASFRNVVYIVSFDRARVEKALSEDGIPGRDYLEKILQLAVDLPRIPADFFNRHVFSTLNDALDGITGSESFDSDLWPDIYMEVIRPLMRNMRDARRYAIAVRVAASELAGQIQLVDVLALEAIRVFLPDVFGAMATRVDALTTTANPFSTWGSSSEARRSQVYEAQVQQILSSAGDKADVVLALIRRCFPAAQRHIGEGHFADQWRHQWRLARRVAHEDMLNLYLERTASSSLIAFNSAERAFKLMADADQLNSFIRSIEPEMRQDLISSLEAFEPQYSGDQVVPTSIVLLNILTHLPDLNRGMFSLGSGLVVSRIVIRLLKTLPDRDAVAEAVDRILPELNNLSAKLHLIGDIGHWEGRGAKLVSEAKAESLEAEWREKVRGAPAADLMKEQDLLTIMMMARRGWKHAEPEFSVDPSPEFTRALLSSSTSDIQSATVGNRAVRRRPRLQWDVLVEIYGGEENLKERVEELRNANPSGIDDLLDLAARYLSGWRPEEFGRGNTNDDE